MNDVCRMIKKQTVTNFSNMETAIKTYDRNALSAVHLLGGMCITLFTRRTSGFSIRQNSQNRIFTKTEWIIPIILAMLF